LGNYDKKQLEQLEEELTSPAHINQAPLPGKTNNADESSDPAMHLLETIFLLTEPQVRLMKLFISNIT
jgi:hypothetical protein